MIKTLRIFMFIMKKTILSSLFKILNNIKMLKTVYFGILLKKIVIR